MKENGSAQERKFCLWLGCRPTQHCLISTDKCFTPFPLAHWSRRLNYWILHFLQSCKCENSWFDLMWALRSVPWDFSFTDISHFLHMKIVFLFSSGEFTFQDMSVHFRYWTVNLLAGGFAALAAALTQYYTGYVFSLSSNENLDDFCLLCKGWPMGRKYTLFPV